MSNTLELSFELPPFWAHRFTHTAFLSQHSHILRVGEFQSTGLAHQGLARASCFQISPFPVPANVIYPLIKTHRTRGPETGAEHRHWFFGALNWINFEVHTFIQFRILLFISCHCIIAREEPSARSTYGKVLVS